MSVCLREKDRNSHRGMQIDRAGADGGGCEIDTLNQEPVNVLGEKAVIYCTRAQGKRDEEHPKYDIYRQ